MMNPHTIRLFWKLVGAFLGALPSLVFGADREAVVLLRSGSGTGSAVVISPSGLMLTAEHVTSRGGSLSAVVSGKRLPVRIVQDAQRNGVDEPVLLALPNGNYPWAPIADVQPVKGDKVYSYGFPAGQFTRRSGRFSGNTNRFYTAGFAVKGGHSGGGLFNNEGHLIGICSATDGKSSYWIPVVGYRPTRVIVFTSPNCGPCEKVKADHKAGKFKGYDLHFVQWGTAEYRAMEAQFQQATGKKVTRAPTFWYRGSAKYATGYDGPTSLLGWLKAILGGITRLIVGEPRAPPSAPVPADEPKEEKPAFGGTKVIILIPRKDFGLLKGLAVKKLEQIASEKLNGVPVEIVFERLEPKAYAAIDGALKAPEETPAVDTAEEQELPGGWLVWVLSALGGGGVGGFALKHYLQGRAEKSSRLYSALSALKSLADSASDKPSNTAQQSSGESPNSTAV